MKLLIRVALILPLLISCSKSNREASPSNPLYKNWKLTETKTITGNWETAPHESVVEFRSDGSIRYQKPTPPPPCCSPVRFERQNQTLKLSELFSGPGCEHVDCAPPSEYKIVSLTADELILENVYSYTYPANRLIMKYKPAQ
jgi:hypothetical protein